MPSTTAFEVVLVPFPFADLSATKRRPCLVLASYKPGPLPQHVVLAMMTSQVSSPRFPFDVELNHIATAGLPKPTLVRLGKLVTLDSTLIVKSLGMLHSHDRGRVRAEFGRLFRSLL
jgi:mRNA interferase MazF